MTATVLSAVPQKIPTTFVCAILIVLSTCTCTSHMDCAMATLKGRRRSMEDRVVCIQDLCALPVEKAHGDPMEYTSWDETTRATCGVSLPFQDLDASNNDASVASMDRRDRCGLSKIGESEAATRAGAVAYAAVFDGHEGSKASEFSALCLHHLLAQEMRATLHRPTSQHAWIRRALRRALIDLDRRFLQHAGADAPDGTTAVVALAVRGMLLVASVGDSPAVLCARDQDARAAPGRLRSLPARALPLTRPHNPSDLEERARISAAGGRVTLTGGRWRVQGELLVSRAIGAQHYRKFGVIPEPDIGQWMRVNDSSGSLVLLGSDGVFDGLEAHLACQLALSSVTGAPPPVLPKRPEPIALPPPPTDGEAAHVSSILEEAAMDAHSPSGTPTPDAHEAQTASTNTNGNNKPLVKAARAVAEAAYKQQSTDNIAVVLLQFEPWNANNKLHSQPSPRAQEGAPNQPSAELGTEVDLVSGGGKDLLNQVAGYAPEEEVEEDYEDHDELSLNEGLAAASLRAGQKVAGASARYVLERTIHLISSPRRMRPPASTTASTVTSAATATAGTSATPTTGAASEAMRELPSEASETLEWSLVAHEEGDDESAARSLEGSAHHSQPVRAAALASLARSLSVAPLSLLPPLDRHSMATCVSPTPVTGRVCAAHFPVVMSHVAALRPAPWAQQQQQTAWPMPLELETDTDQDVRREDDASAPRRAWTAGFTSVLQHGKLGYHLHHNVGRGKFGEVWRARRHVSPEVELPDSEDNADNSEVHKDSQPEANVEASEEVEEQYYVLKRIFVERGLEIRLSGMREAYFGDMFQNVSHRVDGHLEGCITRFVESFEMHNGRELWLVFFDEGAALSQVMYSAVNQEDQADANDQDSSGDVEADPNSHSREPGKGDEPESSKGDARTSQGAFSILGPSPWWRAMKREPSGRAVLQDLMRQMFQDLSEVHAAGVAHRDLKPDNLLVREKGHKGPGFGSQPRVSGRLALRLGDFGSAVNVHVLEKLYGARGPSARQQTQEYSAPEAIFNVGWRASNLKLAMKYDMWSAGIVLLEVLALGTPQVIELHPRTRVLLEKKLQGYDAEAKELIYLLRAMMEWCIYPPPPRRSKVSKSSLKYLNDSAVFDGDSVSPNGGQCDSEDVVGDGTIQDGNASKRTQRSWGQDAASEGESESTNKLPISWECTDQAFAEYIKARDPTKLGLPNIWALRLVRRLLSWRPDSRPTSTEVLQHAFFKTNLDEHPDGQGYRCLATGQEYEWKWECQEKCMPNNNHDVQETHSTSKMNSCT